MGFQATASIYARLDKACACQSGRFAAFGENMLCFVCYVRLIFLGSDVLFQSGPVIRMSFVCFRKYFASTIEFRSGLSASIP